MKKCFIPLILLLAIIAGCKKDTQPSNPDTPPKNYTDKIILNNPQIVGDSVKLTWSILDTSAFIYYTLLRKDYNNSVPNALIQITKKDQTTVIDKAVPYSPQIQYQVEARLASGKIISSNTVSYNRPEIKTINVTPLDILYSSDEQTLYFINKNGGISIYSIPQSAVTKSISTNAVIGYCSLGTYNGRKELYVPRNDGWVFIYDAITLDKIGQISTGLNNSCVVFHNNNLYVSTSAWTNRPLKVYDRQSGNKISETGDFDLTRFKQVPNTNFDLFEITLHIGPVDQDYYSFTPNGTFLSHSDDRYHGDHPLDAAVFEFFPDGSKYITSSSGAIYNRNMTYDRSLPRGNLLFTTFAFDQSAKLIYAGTQGKTIEVYSMIDYQHSKTIKTKAYPYKVIEVGNEIISVSSLSQLNTCSYCQVQSPTNVVIEKFSK